MPKLNSSDYKVFSNFLNKLAKKLTNYYYLKLNKPFKVTNKEKTKTFIKNNKIQSILWAPGKRDDYWKSDLERFEKGDVTLTRRSAGESSIKSIQRLLFF